MPQFQIDLGCDTDRWAELDEFEKQCKELTLDRMNAAPKEEVEPQTKLSLSLHL